MPNMTLGCTLLPLALAGLVATAQGQRPSAPSGLPSAPASPSTRTPPEGTPAAAPTDARPLPERLPAILEEIRARDGLPALAALVLRNGAVVAEASSGRRCADCETPVGASDLWHLGSCTKAITATLVAVLVQEGLLSWEMTLAKAFPDWAERMKPEYREVTLRDLLRMRGGVPGGGPPEAWARAWSMDGTPTEQRRRYCEAVLREQAPGPQGQMQYSNEAYAIAGLICETVAGMPYEELVRTRIAVPLGLTSLGFGAPGAVEEPCTPTQPCGHRTDGSCVKPSPMADNPPALSPAGRAHMTLRDWATFVQAHLRGEREGIPALKLQAAAVQALHDPGTGPGTPYAGGWLVRPHPRLGRERPTLWHNGSNTMWYVEALLSPEQDLAILVACNSGSDGAKSSVREVLRRLAEEAAPAARGVSSAP